MPEILARRRRLVGLSLTFVALVAAPGAAQQTRDTAAPPAPARSHPAVAGAGVITIFPDSLPDVPRTMSELLVMGAPGVFVQHASGAVAAGSWISIRDGAAVRGLGPLVVVDGVRTVALVARIPETTERRAPSLLDEVRVEDVERVDVLLGPAAAVRYGRDARTGVIEITTRRPGRGAPTVHASLSGAAVGSGDEFPRNGTRIGSGGYICTPGDPSPACAASAPSRYTPLLDMSPFRTAGSGAGRVSVSGGIGSLGYSVGLSHSAMRGALASDRDAADVGVVRLTLPVGAAGRLDVASNTALRSARVPFEGNASIVSRGITGAVDCSQATPCSNGDTISRGYMGALASPEQQARRGTGHRVRHFSNGLALTTRAADAVTLRTVASNDAYTDHGGWDYSELTTRGNVYDARLRHTERAVQTVVGEELTAHAPVGGGDVTTELAVHASDEQTRSSVARGAAAGGTVAGSSAGYRVAERRIVGTLAPRYAAALGSAGFVVSVTSTRFKYDRGGLPLTADAGADAALVLRNRENARLLRRATLRAAAAQVSAFEPPRDLFFSLTGTAPIGFTLARNANGDIHPDRSYEGEGGADLGFAPLETRLSVSAFRRRETHRGMRYGPTYPYGGFVTALRRVVNGVELAAGAVPFQRGSARLQIDLAFTVQADRVTSEPASFNYLYTGLGGLNSLLLTRGRSYGSWQARGYTPYDANGNGVIQAGEYELLPYSYVGRSRPSRFGSMEARLALARRWVLGADIGYQAGYKVLDKVETLRCSHVVCDAWQSTSAVDQTYALLAGTTPYFVTGEALRIRELSLAYGPPAFAHAVRAGRAEVSLVVRNLATFSRARYMDPETELPAPGFASDLVQGPGIARPRVVAIRVAASY